MQQQKLRARKEQQQHRDGIDIYDRINRTDLHSKPARSRSSASHRYDGYVSDTAAFNDEVDYRRPLHIQTPNRFVQFIKIIFNFILLKVYFIIFYLDHLIVIIIQLQQQKLLLKKDHLLRFVVLMIKQNKDIM